jgi:EmrB/QacA subfamily drug resistance transporter
MPAREASTRPVPAAGGSRHLTLTFAALTVGALAFCLLQSMVIPALPEIQRSLHTSASGVAWLLTAYLVSASVATPILGRLGDMFGKHRMLVIVFATMSIGSVIAGLATSIGVLIVARVIQGTAGAVFPISFGIIRDEFPQRRVAGAIGILSAMIGIGSGLGIVIAGPVIDHLSYHWLFWIPLMLSGAATIAAAIWVPASPVRNPGRVNVSAAVTLTIWLVSLLIGISQGPTWGWLDPRTLGCFGLAVVSFFIWVAVERASEQPLVDLRMMSIPAVWWTNVAALLIGVGMYAQNVIIPPFIQTPSSEGYGFGASVTSSGFLMLPSTVAMLVAGLVIGRITLRLGSRGALLVGCLAAAVPWVILAIAHAELWQILLATSLTGFGIGMSYAAMPTLIMAAVPASQTGIATGMNANIRTIGGSIGTVLVATILASHPSAAGYPAENSYVWSFVVLLVTMLAAAAAALAIPKLALAHVPVEDRMIGPEPLSLAADGGAMLAES